MGNTGIRETATTILVLMIIFLAFAVSFIALRSDLNRVKEQDYFKKQFGIELTAKSDEDLNSVQYFVKPVVGKRIKELEADYNLAAAAFLKNETGIAGNNEKFQKMVAAKNNLKEACESAKYFKIIPQDWEPCKAVQ